jgi:hypothetical protein
VSPTGTPSPTTGAQLWPVCIPVPPPQHLPNKFPNRHQQVPSTGAPQEPQLDPPSTVSLGTPAGTPSTGTQQIRLPQEPHRNPGTPSAASHRATSWIPAAGRPCWTPGPQAVDSNWNHPLPPVPQRSTGSPSMPAPGCSNWEPKYSVSTGTPSTQTPTTEAQLWLSGHPRALPQQQQQVPQQTLPAWVPSCWSETQQVLRAGIPTGSPQSSPSGTGGTPVQVLHWNSKYRDSNKHATGSPHRGYTSPTGLAGSALYIDTGIPTGTQVRFLPQALKVQPLRAQLCEWPSQSLPAESPTTSSHPGLEPLHWSHRIPLHCHSHKSPNWIPFRTSPTGANWNSNYDISDRHTEYPESNGAASPTPSLARSAWKTEVVEEEDCREGSSGGLDQWLNLC